MRQTIRDRSDRGFTLVELLIVVVILGILATLAGIGYRRYVGRARTTEAIAMLGEMTAKQGLYFSEFAAYVPLRADNDLTQPSVDEAAAAFYPVNPTSGGLESTRTATSIANSAAWPAAWRAIGMRPKGTDVYCTYLLNAGTATTAVPVVATLGTSLLGTAVRPAAWFYALAACNLNGAAGFPAEVSTFALSSESPRVNTFNEGR